MAANTHIVGMQYRIFTLLQVFLGENFLIGGRKWGLQLGKKKRPGLAGLVVILLLKEQIVIHFREDGISLLSFYKPFSMY